MTPTAAGIDPVRWWIFDGFCPPLAVADIPGDEWGGWEARYANDCEANKRTSRDLAAMPRAAADTLARIESAPAVAEWCDRLGYAVLPDPTRHGGGFHVTGPSGRLNPHLDYDRHPLMPAWRRALNVIAFLHPTWRSEWGGEFLLCDPLGNVVKRIDPEPGRVIAFEVSDLSYHGVGRVTGPAERASVASYFLSPAGPHNTRRRALFLPAR